MWVNRGAKEGERESCSDASWELSRGEKINMVLNIHYLCLSVGWVVPRGDFNYDEVVMFSFYHCAIQTVAIAV